MLFNSWTFVWFLILFFIGYWFTFNKTVRLQNAFIALSSFIFYGWWDVRFLLLLLLSLIVDFSVGYYLEQTTNLSKRKALLYFSLLFNLGILALFKYYNFFAQSTSHFLQLFGFHPDFVTINIVLPIGISFYTFQSLSYTIEVYRKKLKATSDIAAYAAFISFFPQLVAGPIERAAHMLPQYYRHRKFNYYKAAVGMRMILWGMFKKVVIADTCAGYANDAFNNYLHRDGLTLIIGAIYFAFQIYGDFSGYTDIARGLAKLFGFELKVNFLYPYFSKNIADFWRRWHISLTSWFRDYVYIPLGGSRQSKAITIRNTFAVFLVSGLWHGANWTFICWGLLHALFMLPLLLFNLTKKPLYTVETTNKVNWRDILQIGITFSLAVIAWVFFRALDIQTAFDYLRHMLHITVLTLPGKSDAFILVIILIFIDWIGRKNESAIEGFLQQFPKLKYVLYLSFGLLIYVNFSRQTSFIYFQF